MGDVIVVVENRVLFSLIKTIHCVSTFIAVHHICIQLFPSNTD